MMKQTKENKLLGPCLNPSSSRSLPVKSPLLILFDLTSSVLLCLDLLSSMFPSVFLFSHEFLSAFILSFDPVLPPLFIFFLRFHISSSIQSSLPHLVLPSLLSHDLSLFPFLSSPCPIPSSFQPLHLHHIEWMKKKTEKVQWEGQR